MPRANRFATGGVCFHVLNRGNRRAIVFHDALDYARFLGYLRRAAQYVDVEVFGYCLMPNHFHIVARARRDGSLGRWMHRVTNAYVRRYERRYGTTGRIWQGRYKAFPIQEDGHLLSVLRYVEANALRAHLVGRAEDWRWGSLFERVNKSDRRMVCASPVPLPDAWIQAVNGRVAPAALDALRLSVNRGRPFGSPEWTKEAAGRLGLSSTLRPYKRSSTYRS